MKTCPYCKKENDDNTEKCSCGYDFNYVASEHAIKIQDDIQVQTKGNSSSYSKCTIEDNIKAKLSVSLTFLCIGVLLSFFIFSIGLILSLGSIMAFFIINPGDIKGVCPSCGSPIKGYLKSNITACSSCHARISVDHNKKIFRMTNQVG